MTTLNGSRIKADPDDIDSRFDGSAMMESMEDASVGPDIDDTHYEPWLFQTMLNELTEHQLGIGFVYSLLDQLAQRHNLTDAIVLLPHEGLGTQAFRLGGRTVSPEMATSFGSEPGVHCVPDIVSEQERDAVRTACQLAFWSHLARFSSTHDSLTNIANVRSFENALKIACHQAARNGWAFTLVLVDLNDFKLVNDKLGHPRGDALLREFGFALRRSVRAGDTAARIGGDEFAVILSNAEGHDSAGFIERLRANLAITGNEIDFTTGTATSPRDSTDPARLKEIADDRLYEKKGVKHR